MNTEKKGEVSLKKLRVERGKMRDEMQQRLIIARGNVKAKYIVGKKKNSSDGKENSREGNVGRESRTRAEQRSSILSLLFYKKRVRLTIARGLTLAREIAPFRRIPRPLEFHPRRGNKSIAVRQRRLI